MAKGKKTPYEVLGVPETASAEELARAYRTRVVVTHRRGVLDVVDALKQLAGAYRALKDPDARRAIDTARAAASATSQSGPEGTVGVRTPAARELGRHSIRVGELAKRENAATVRALSNEYDRRELAARTARRRREWMRLGVRLFCLVLLVVLAAVAARHAPEFR